MQAVTARLGRTVPPTSARVTRACVGSDRLIDLYQLHARWGDPFEETLVVLDEIVTEEGALCRSSNLAHRGRGRLGGATGGYERFVSAQNKYSIYDRAAEAARSRV